MAPADANGDGKPKTWVPSAKDGAVLLMLAGGTFGSYKLIDANVAQEIRANGQQISLLAARVEAIGQKTLQVEGALTAVQNDRLHDLRTVFERGSQLQGMLDTQKRQLDDVKQSLDGIERRTQDTDRDIKQSLGELRGEVNHALRAPLPGPRR